PRWRCWRSDRCSVQCALCPTPRRPPPRQERAMSQPGPDLPRAEDRIIEGTNQFRQREGRGRLRSNARLAKTAREFAQYLARTGKFSHTADGRQPWERTAAQGYAEAIVAENLGWELNSAGFTTDGLADALVEGWKNSPHHRQNMLDP